MLNKLLLKLAKRISGKSFFEYSVEKQEAYLKKFREPRSNVERSFFQYKSQMKLKGFRISLLVNFASIPLTCWYFIKPSQRCDKTKKADAVFIMDGNVSENILPKSLKKEFSVLELYSNQNTFLNWNDRKYILRLLFRYPFSWHFALKSVIKIMRYRWVINSFSPKSLIVHNEYSFTSSMLTDYCNTNGVELINVMHGEKLFYMRDSFFKFNRCYVWSEAYKDLFDSLRASPEQFIVELPPSMLFEKQEACKTIDYTYYLQAQNGENLKYIISLLKCLCDKGYKVAVRPHPRYTSIEQLEQYTENSNIKLESCKDITIQDSILRTKNVISVYSTVLQQAHYNGATMVIDDLSDKELYNALKKLKYVVLDMDVCHLSGLIND